MRFEGEIAEEATIQYIFYPLVEWPEEMTLAIPDEAGQPLAGEAIHLFMP